VFRKDDEGSALAGFVGVDLKDILATGGIKRCVFSEENVRSASSSYFTPLGGTWNAIS
jgi:hypothetical protein